MATILIIDDNDELCNLLVELLEGEGYETAVASDGEIGVRAFTQLRPDLVITDMVMPTPTGSRQSGASARSIRRRVLSRFRAVQ